MVGPTVDQLDAELEQPHAQPGPALPGGVTPGRAVVDEDRLGQPIATEGRLQVRLHGLGLLIGAGLQARGEARVVVDDGQRVTPLATGQRHPALEVHLPEQVGRFLLEPQVSPIG